MSEFVEQTKLGEGGFGAVYVCEKGNGSFAVKKLSVDCSKDAEARFQREIRILSTLDHPNIVKILSHQWATKPFHYIMPLYACSLERERVRIREREERLNKIFRAVLDGMEYAHEQGVLHRDLKPANILMNNDDDVVVSDFGLGRFTDSSATRFTQTGHGLGSYFYMAPEQQHDGKHADRRSDVFALGRILYVMHVGALVPLVFDLSKVPGHARVVINKCCQNDIDKRFQTVSELKSAWLTTIGAFPSPPAEERVNSLIGELHGGPASNRDDKIGELCDHLMTKLDDEDLVHGTVMKVPVDALARLAAFRFDDFRMILRLFCEATARRSYGFSYTDRIGDKIVSLYRAVADYETRADLLHCLLEVGHGHNRFYLMDLFETLIREPRSPGEGFAIVERLKTATPRHLARVSKKLARSAGDKSLLAFFDERAKHEDPP